MFRIDPNLDVPIYRQLVDEIQTAIKKGDLPVGTQLPTVQALAQKLGLARGTVNRAYTDLAQLGLIESVQGRGTFVRYQPMCSQSKHEQAVDAINRLLDQMEVLGLSAREARLLYEQALRKRELSRANLKVAVVECNPETLSRLTDQLQVLGGIDLYPYLLSQIQAYPYQLDNAMDLIVTTAEHSEYLRSVLTDQKKIARIALRLSPASVSRIVKIKADERIGLLGCSARFAELLLRACSQFADHVQPLPPEVLSPDLDLPGFLRDKSTVLVPEEFEKIALEEHIRLLRDFAAAGKLIRCSYEMDEGSYLYLQEKIGRLQEKKAI